MKRIIGKAAGLCLFLSAPALAADQLVGTWQMIYQQIGSAHMAPLPIALKVTQSGSSLQFDYLMNRELELTRSFTVRTDGSPAPIKNSSGAVVGIAKLTKSSATEYKLVMQSPNKPAEPGKLTLSEGGKILRCDSEAILPDRGTSHIVQVFAKQGAEPQ